VKSGEDVAGRPGLVASPTSGGISVEENIADDADSDEDSASAVVTTEGDSADGDGGSAIVEEYISRRYAIADTTVEQRTFGRDNRGTTRASIIMGEVKHDSHVNNVKKTVNVHEFSRNY